MGKKNKGKNREKRDKTTDTAISKTLSFLLRHGALEAGLQMRPDGFVKLNEVLRYEGLRGVSVHQVEKIVAASDKQRFLLTVEEGQTFIRANQGHTLTGLKDDALLTEIHDAADAPVCIHGTYRRCIAPILCGGLSRMARNHIHCATLMPKEGVVSGMRTTCNIAVYIDVRKSMSLGIKWYRSANGVLLTPGDDAGLVPPSCFEKVVDLATGERISIPAVAIENVPDTTDCTPTTSLELEPEPEPEPEPEMETDFDLNPWLKYQHGATSSTTKLELQLPPTSYRLSDQCFAFVIKGLLAPSECANWIVRSEQRGYKRATISSGRGQRLDTQVRNSGRNMYDSKPDADLLYQRLKPHLPEVLRGRRCAGLNERLRFLRYDPGEYFAPHFDGEYRRNDGQQISRLTVMLYLNSGGVDYDGGETRFLPITGGPSRFVPKPGADYGLKVVPEIGDCLVFSHEVFHEGLEVTRGRKYAVRTDVMYERQNHSAHAKNSAY